MSDALRRCEPGVRKNGMSRFGACREDCSSPSNMYGGSFDRARNVQGQKKETEGGD